MTGQSQNVELFPELSSTSQPFSTSSEQLAKERDVMSDQSRKGEVQKEEHGEYGHGICLIWTIFKDYKIGGHGKAGCGKVEVKDTAEIPATTEFVHIAITGVKMSFGSADDPLNGTFQGILFQTVVNTPRDQLKNGTVNFTVQANLAHETNADPWFGNLAITIMCFGK